MNEEPKPISLAGVRSVALAERSSKITLEQAGRPWERGRSFPEFLRRLPRVLAVSDFMEVAEAMALARRATGMVVLGMGAHPIKVGLGPIIIDLMERRILSGVAMTGAGIIHDAELALAGRTSEDVAAALAEGTFGMSRETADFLNRAISRHRETQRGLGFLVGQALLESGAPHLSRSILATGARIGTPVTVHVALGADIIHLHPSVDPGATGEASHLDFRIFAHLVAALEEGVYLNLGSAVFLPEVFLKALALVRNLGYRVERFTTVNMDFQRHYRPRVNVVERPVLKGGRGYELIGHHEIMVPLLAAAVIELLG
ncbi:MAG TPA: hypothetical protein VMU60_09960 [Syntrophobacteria bacterium]|nr:hypothetical protein [Syntrophobacteria bacterium]